MRVVQLGFLKTLVQILKEVSAFMPTSLSTCISATRYAVTVIYVFLILAALASWAKQDIASGFELPR